MIKKSEKRKGTRGESLINLITGVENSGAVQI